VKLYANRNDISEILPQIAERLNQSDTFHNIVVIDKTTLKCVYKQALNVVLQFYSGNMVDTYQRTNHLLKQNSSSFDLLYLIKIMFIENQINSSWDVDMDLIVLWLTVYFLQNGHHTVLPSIRFFLENGRFNYSTQYESPRIDFLELFYQFFNFYANVDINEIICLTNIGTRVNKDCANDQKRLIRIKEQFSDKILTSSIEFRNLFELTVKNITNLYRFMKNAETTDYSIFVCIIRDKTLIPRTMMVVYSL
jgi:hypothetical protein